jgi:hypothetical protein
MGTIKFKGKNEKGVILEFDFTSDVRKAYPYIAIIKGYEDGKFSREFINLSKFKDKNTVNISGEYAFMPGTIIECQEGGSWKNIYRYFYLIKEDELEYIGRANEISIKKKVIKYLKTGILE